MANKRKIPSEAGYTNRFNLKCVAIRFEDGKEIHSLKCKCGVTYELPYKGAWSSAGCIECKRIKTNEYMRKFSKFQKEREANEIEQEASSVPSPLELTNSIFQNYRERRHQHMIELDEIGGSRK